MKVLTRCGLRLLLLLALLVSALGLTSCATTDDSENLSSRPWNSPRGWETGLPGGMSEGRYGR